MTRPATELQGRLNYQFTRPDLLEQALRHRSMDGAHNERLEFLGDGLLNAMVGAALYERCPREDEGALSRLRASLVCERSLAALSRGLGLGEFLRLGESERKSGGHRRDSILADGLEAVLGAVYLDGGFEAARTVCLHWYRDLLVDLPDPEQLKDAKTRLQEWLQARSRPLPVYEVLEASGPPHRRRFRVRCRLDDSAEHSEAEAASRRHAEQQAAERLLHTLVASSTAGDGYA